MMMTESIMIVVDNSCFVPEDSPVRDAQFELIRLYCRAKVKSNSKTSIGIATLGGEGGESWPARPTTDHIEHLLTYGLENIPWGGEYHIIHGLQFCQLGFAHIDPLDKVIKRRLLVFVGGPCDGYLADDMLEIGRSMRRNNIALDVVSFPYKNREADALKTKNLRSFVAAANNNKLNNSHFARFPLDSSALEVLVSSKILSLSQAEGAQRPYMEEEKLSLISMRKKKKSLRRNRRRKNHDSQQEASSSPSPPSSSSSRPTPPPVVIIPAPQKFKIQNQLVFGSWEMDHLVKALSPISAA